MEYVFLNHIVFDVGMQKCNYSSIFEDILFWTEKVPFLIIAIDLLSVLDFVCRKQSFWNEILLFRITLMRKKDRDTRPALAFHKSFLWVSWDPFTWKRTCILYHALSLNFVNFCHVIMLNTIICKLHTCIITQVNF